MPSNEGAANNKNNSSTSQMLSSLYPLAQLGIAKSLSVLPTQPLQVVMRRQQAALADKRGARVLSARQAAKEIWHQTDNMALRIAAVYRGTGPAMIKEFAKNTTYKGLFILGAPTIAANLHPEWLKNNLSPGQFHFSTALLAGTIAGTGDVLFGGPFEAWATFRATSQGDKADASFVKEFKEGKNIPEKMARLYRGAIPSIVKGSIAFSTFFYSASPIKASVYQFYGVDKQQPAPWYATLTASTLSGITVALTSSPFDIVKTQAQMPGANGKSLTEALKSNVKSHGIAGLGAGLFLKSVMISMGWGIAFFVTQRNNVTHHEKKESSLSPKQSKVMK